MYLYVFEENAKSRLLVENNNLLAYCTSDAGIDIIVLAFLHSSGNRNHVPSGTIGQSFSITNTGEGQDCGSLASAITKCQSKGIKIMLSLGGAVGSYTLSSNDEAAAIGNSLWELYRDPLARPSSTASTSTSSRMAGASITRP